MTYQQNIPAISGSPCYPCKSYKQYDLSNIRKLYHSQNPVPGIYAITANNRHFLVAIKSEKGKKDTKRIFEPTKETYYKVATSLDNDNATAENSFEGEDYYFRTTERVKMIQQQKPIQIKTFRPFNKNPTQRKFSPRNHHIKSRDNQFPPLFDLLSRYGKSRLQEGDFRDFRRLRNPLRIEYCLLTKRWMFDNEIKARTQTVSMCSKITCMKKSHEKCENKKDRELFALDDCYSWEWVQKTETENEKLE